MRATATSVTVLALFACGSAASPVLAASPHRAHQSVRSQRSAGSRLRRRRERAERRHDQARLASKPAAPSPGQDADPSGVPMPTGNIRGWHQVFADDFTGTSLNSNRWRTYGGEPGGDPGGWWAPSHASVSGGELVLAGYQDPADGGAWTTAGVSSSPGLTQTYGKYLVRFRVDSGDGISYAVLLWPADNSWPPEVDFSEDRGGNRQTDYATLHYGANNSQIQNELAVDLTGWHTLGVDWTPGRLVYTVDGRTWATVNSSEVPSVPMVLDIQTEAWACGVSSWESCIDATTPAVVNLDVDWVVAYSPA